MDESLKRKAYLEGMRLKNSGMEPEIIYARLEKQGIPPELAKHVIRNIYLESSKKKQSELKEDFNFNLILAAVGILLAIVFPFIFPGIILLPVGLVIGGITFAILAYNKMKK